MKNNNLVKIAVAGIVGYFIGFYEMKYKTMRVLAKAYMKEREIINKKSDEQ